MEHPLCALAKRDVLVVAGKGHEDYQEVAGVRLPFSDLAEVHKGLDAWSARMPAQGVAS